MPQREQAKQSKNILFMEDGTEMLRKLPLIIILLLMIPLASHAQERHIATYAGVSGSLGPQWMSVDLGLFGKYGLNVDWVLMTGGARGIQAMLSGTTSFFTGDPVGAISVALQGGDIAIIGTMLNRLPGSIAARKEIREPSDLQGKRIGIAAFGGSNELSVILSLKKWNIPREAVILMQSGSPSDRLIALIRGAIDAAPLAPPESLEASRRGMNILIDFTEIEAFPQRVIVVRRSFLKKNRVTVKRFMQAYSEGVYYFITNRAKGIATYAKWLRQENPKVNEETYDYFRGMLSLPPRMVRGEGLRIGLQMIAQRAGRAGTDIALNQFLDESVIDELESEGFFKKFITK